MSLQTIVAGLEGILDDIRVADEAASSARIQIVGWRGQKAHTAPAAWVNLRASTADRSAGRVLERMPFELWLTRNPADCEDRELRELARLADLALPIVDDRLAPSAVAGTLGVDQAKRTGFSFTTADAAEGAGAASPVPALLIPVTVEWRSTHC